MLGELGAPSTKVLLSHTDIIAQAERFLEAEYKLGLERWLASRSDADADAEELISIASIANRIDDPEVKRASDFLLQRLQRDEIRQGFLSRLLEHRNTSNGSLPTEEAQIRVEISRRKRLLDLNPRDALRLTETALLYVIIGQTKQAWSLLRRALILRPDDRYVLRATSRFFMHRGEPDVALDVLSHSPAVRIDPWLKSARLAIEAVSGRSPSGWKKAKALLTDSSFSPRDLSELAVQMGSMEYEAGSRKQALRMLRLGAVSPTENAVAQIGWVARKKRGLRAGELDVDVSLSHEASAYASYEQGNWSEAVSHCEAWRKIEPFSARPVIHGTFVACVSMEALGAASALGTLGLLANSKNKTLLNNLAVVKAFQGQLEESHALLLRAQATDGDEDEEIIVLASSGLLDFRESRPESGLDKYIEAMEKAINRKNHGLAFRAFCYLSREIAHIDDKAGVFLLEKIDSNIAKAEKRNITIPKDIIIMREQIVTSIRSIEAIWTAPTLSFRGLDDFFGDGALQ
ncbi:hypothetical protein [Rhizobium lusitanum]|uniref:hypothetical protein n=1 Tax=Rhizobium lusitanum TaxID=293958 RepID=UPI001958B0C3|nr:hypothetical protein [Rhizobium lusitanum]MBM7049681.1 hypothetical protein [Rhizobium lusitanum]